MNKWICLLCGLVYDEARGWPSRGIPPRTRWQDVPDDWRCPDCGATKSQFKMMKLN